jgi:hypothetical protein
VKGFDCEYGSCCERIGVAANDRRIDRRYVVVSLVALLRFDRIPAAILQSCLVNGSTSPVTSDDTRGTISVNLTTSGLVSYGSA